MSINNQKYTELLTVSNPKQVSLNLKRYFKNEKVVPNLLLSSRKNKKYMIISEDGTRSHFGDINYQDFTKHQDKNRQLRYLTRANAIRGNWKNDMYSPNNLSIHVLWQ